MSVDRATKEPREQPENGAETTATFCGGLFGPIGALSLVRTAACTFALTTLEAEGDVALEADAAACCPCVPCCVVELGHAEHTNKSE